MGGNDWVEVRLSAAGEARAEGAPLHVHEGHHQFTFVAGEAQRVTRAFDWEMILSRQTIGGQPLFEIVDDAHAERLVEKWRGEGYDAEVEDGRPCIITHDADEAEITEEKK